MSTPTAQASRRLLAFPVSVYSACPACGAKPSGSGWTRTKARAELIERASFMVTWRHADGCPHGPVTQLDLADYGC